MAEYEAVIYYHAADDDDADALYEQLLTALGCTDEPDHECPHFIAGIQRPIANTRRAAFRQCWITLSLATRLAITGRP